MPQVGTNSAIAQKIWRAGTAHQAEWQCFGMEFVSSDPEAPFVLMDDLSKNDAAGDQVKFKFSPTDDTSDGFGDTDNVEGFEDELEIVQDSFIINYLLLAYKQHGQMSQQRTNVDLKKAAMVKLANRWARRMDQSLANQLCGFTPAMYKTNEGAENGNSAGDNYKRTGLNPIVQYDTNHIYRFSGETTDEGLDSGDLISFTVIDEVIEMATRRGGLTYPLTPCSDGYFHLFISPRQFTTLKASTSPGHWMDIQRAIIEGGGGYANSAFKRYFAGVYSQTKIHVWPWITNGVNSSNAYAAVTTVDRAVFVGAGTLALGYGKGYANDDHLDWVEQVREFKKWSVGADSTFGISRVRHQLPSALGGARETYGAILVPTYEA